MATAGMPANLFLKHLVVLSDVGGENLKRYRTEMPKFFPGGTMRFYWKDSEHVYTFRSLKEKGVWSNPELRIDGRGLAIDADLSPAMEDAATLLIHGGASIDPDLPDSIPEKCTIGSFIEACAASSISSLGSDTFTSAKCFGLALELLRWGNSVSLM